MTLDEALEKGATCSISLYVDGKLSGWHRHDMPRRAEILRGLQANYERDGKRVTYAIGEPLDVSRLGKTQPS